MESFASMARLFFLPESVVGLSSLTGDVLGKKWHKCLDGSFLAFSLAYSADEASVISLQIPNVLRW